MKKKQPKAAVLMSGGLDSMLAAKILIDQGVNVEAVNYLIGFNSSKPAIKAAETLDIKLHTINAITEYKSVLLHPKSGYGANLNPCLDCKVFMVKKTMEMLETHQFDFIATGEVIGQRPKSQLARTMPIVARRSSANDLLLRPLCAKLLPPTTPEKNNWVKREKLYDFNGRSRKGQIKLAAEFGLTNYEQPAGGCLLTDSNYCTRLQDLWNTRQAKDYDATDIELLKIGRHLRLNSNFKVIIGKDAHENELLEKFQNRFPLLHLISHNGPIALIDGKFNDEELNWALRLVGRFSAGRMADRVTIELTLPNVGTKKTLEITPFLASEVLQTWYIPNIC